MIEDLFEIEPPAKPTKSVAGATTAGKDGPAGSGSPTGQAGAATSEAIETILLRVNVQPGAGRTAIAGRHGDALRIRVGAPPVRDRANKECIEAVAELFGVPRSHVELASGSTSRAKRIRVSGVDPAEVRRILSRAVVESSSRQGPSKPAR